MIGTCDCQSATATTSGTFGDPVEMNWSFEYIMNGTAIQDQTLKQDGGHSGSIRQYSLDSAKWYVHYYAAGKISSVSGYHGTKVGDEIALYKRKSDITLADGTKLWYRLTFHNISNDGFNWKGEWVDRNSNTDKVLSTTWKIACVKRNE